MANETDSRLVHEAGQLQYRKYVSTATCIITPGANMWRNKKGRPKAASNTDGLVQRPTDNEAVAGCTAAALAHQQSLE